jgi:hypothetical protein
VSPEIFRTWHTSLIPLLPGTGKSVLLREIIAALRKKFVNKEDSIAVTASTGMAACNIGGMTVHSWSGIGLGTGTVEQICSIVRRNKKALNRWLKAKVLVIDEGTHKINANQLLADQRSAILDQYQWWTEHSSTNSTGSGRN